MNTNISPLGDDEYRKLIEHADKRSAKHGFTVFLIAHSGLTRSEAAHFRPDWFNSSIPAIAVPPEEDGWTPRSQHGVRRIPLSITAAEQLNQYINVLSEDAYEVTPKTIYDRIRTAAQDADIGSTTPRQLRHTFGNMIACRDIPPHVVAQIMGHSIQTTAMEFYHHSKVDLDMDNYPPLYDEQS